MQTTSVKLEVQEGINLILGQAHFIKTVEDIYETLTDASPTIKFGIAFCESSGPALIRYDGNEKKLEDIAVQFARKLSAGHVFVVILENAYPINVLNRLKAVDEVTNIYCATSNPVEVIVVETEQGRGVLGVIDGMKSRGVEGDKEKNERREFLRRIGYKK
ncbi:MAG: adenosine-specific kinase [Nitrososphaerales archaeon]